MYIKTLCKNSCSNKIFTIHGYFETEIKPLRKCLSKTLNNKINTLHKRCLRILYKNSPFAALLARRDRHI